MRILLADDSRAMRSVFREVLERLGHAPADISEAQDWQETRSALRNSSAPIEFVVFDWDLPGMSGSDLSQQLKDMGPAGKARVLFCVSRQQRTLVSKAVRQSSCEYIERPFTNEAFEAKIRGLGGALVSTKGRESSKSLYAIAPMPEVDRGLPFLVQLDSNIVSDLLRLSAAGHHEPKTALLRAGEICTCLHLVTQGKVEILAGAAGKPVRIVGEGDPFGDLSFMTSQPSAETVRTLTQVRTASLSKSRISDLLRIHPTVAGHLTALLGRHKKALADRAVTLEHSDFKGTFDTFPFADVMQMLISTRKTGVLGLRTDQKGGALYLEDGEAIHAWTDELKGEPAFYALSSWTKAKFAFTSIKRQEPRTLMLPTITLLMKAMRQLEQSPSPDAPAKDLGLEDLFPS